MPRHATPAENIPAPAGQALIPLGLRGWVSSFCLRCDQLARLAVGPGTSGLCHRCSYAQYLDQNTRTR